MILKDFIKELQDLGEDAMNLEIQIVASGTIGCPTYDTLAAQVDFNEYDAFGTMDKVVRIDID